MKHKKHKQKNNKQSATVRVRWNKLETALLIDAYRGIKECAITRKDAISRLSVALRKHATNHNLEVDDKYRNENGIAMQLANIQQLMEGTAGARRHNASVFIELVDLYNYDYAQYESILADAIQEYHLGKSIGYSNGSMDNEVSENEDSFYNALKTVLNSHFKYGFNIESPIELIRFRNHCEEKNEPLVNDLEDDALKDAIRECGIEVDGKVYVIDDSGKALITDCIDASVSEGAKLLYYEQLYEKNEDWLRDIHVYDIKVLKALLMSYYPEYRYKEHYFVTDDQMHSEAKAVAYEIQRVWGNQILRNYTELEQLMVYIPIGKIKHFLSSLDLFVWNSPETYTRRDYFSIKDDWLNDIKNVAFEKCDENGSVTFEQLPLDVVSAENYELSETALNDIVFSLISEHFSRSGKIIRLKDSHTDAVTMIREYCKQRDVCTIGELEEVMREAEGVVRYPTIIEAASSIMIRVNEKDFVNEKRVHFDVATIDSILDSIIQDNAIGIRSITTFATFPECGFPWNQFVLESYCRRFSNNFLYDCVTPNSKNSGAIIRASAGLTYLDAMAELLAKSNVELSEKKVFDYLIDSGLIIRRRYSEMGVLIKKANKIREGLER